MFRLSSNRGPSLFPVKLRFSRLSGPRARLSLPGIPWHIIQRGNNRSVCFHAEADYQFYLHYLQEFAVKFGCTVHAYVLMPNHVHMLLTPAREDSAGLMMKHLGQRYVQYINRTYRRSGTLWEAVSAPASRKARQGISFVPRMLTPSERDLLRQDLKNSIEVARAVKV